MPIEYENEQGENLETALDEIKSRLYYVRYFYIISANMDNHLLDKKKKNTRYNTKRI